LPLFLLVKGKKKWYNEFVKRGEGMGNDVTNLFDAKELREKDIEMTLKEVYDSLEERGYQPSNQIVGYLLSGDPGYISSYKEARKKIQQHDRSEILEVLVRNYLDKKCDI